MLPRWLAPVAAVWALSCAGRAPAPPARGVVTGPAGQAYAVVELRARIDECSGAGGEHYIFSIDEGDGARARLAHGGGHARYLGLAPGFALGPAGAASRPPRYFVAELALLPSPRGPGPGAAGWCLDQMPAVHAGVLRLVAAPDRASARRRLAEVARHGMPAEAIDLRPSAAR